MTQDAIGNLTRVAVAYEEIGREWALVKVADLRALLTALDGDEVVERVARIIDPTAFVCNVLDDGTLVIGLPEAADTARQKAQRILNAIIGEKPGD